MNNENKPIQRKSNNEMKNMARGMSKEQRKQMMKEQNPMIPLKRLMGYIWKDYKFQMLLVLAGILMSAITGVIASLFLRTLIDSYITPLLAVCKSRLRTVIPYTGPHGLHLSGRCTGDSRIFPRDGQYFPGSSARYP